jgi:ribosome biogenesis GTPase
LPSSALGWDDAWAAARAAVVHPGPVGRVSRVDGQSCLLLTSVDGPPQRAVVPPKLEEVAVGDWAVFTPDGLVHAVLPRRSLFARSGAGRETRRQPVAANIDTALIVNAIDARLSVRRIERYLAVAWESGATPAVVLTKADLVPAEELGPRAAQVHAVALGVGVYVLGLEDDPAEVLDACIAPGSTVALLGLSGAGKSTLLNRLAGTDLALTQDVRSDGKGRHTPPPESCWRCPAGRW